MIVRYKLYALNSELKKKYYFFEVIAKDVFMNSNDCICTLRYGSKVLILS